MLLKCGRNKKERRKQMTDHISWRHSSLIIPKSRFEKAIDALLEIYQGDLEDIKKLPRIEKVKHLLHTGGFDTEIMSTGDLEISEDRYDQSEIYSDQIFKALIGVVAPGSYLTTWDDGGTYYQMRYKEDEFNIVCGTICFPEDKDYTYPAKWRTD